MRKQDSVIFTLTYIYIPPKLRDLVRRQHGIPERDPKALGAPRRVERGPQGHVQRQKPLGDAGRLLVIRAVAGVDDVRLRGGRSAGRTGGARRAAEDGVHAGLGGCGRHGASGDLDARGSRGAGCWGFLTGCRGWTWADRCDFAGAHGTCRAG